METGELPNVTIQVLPWTSLCPSRSTLPIRSSPCAANPRAGGVAGAHDRRHRLEQRPEVDTTRAGDDLTAAALSPAQSRRYLSDRIKQESGS
ncbi:hypothetical protein [Streptomyces sp. KL116D]|uniref:hypothetical protein n=1 Tax=Streptomyces sp. KL116D TaxID=3045152 RepID=UPI003557D0BC